MATRTQSNYFEDLDRLAENLESNFPGIINDRESLNQSLKEYFDDVPMAKFINGRKRELLKQVIFKQAGGKKNLRRDQKTTSNKVFPRTKEGQRQFIKTGSRRSDLDGVDTRDGKTLQKLKTPKKTKTSIRRDSLIQVGTIKKRVVKARKETVIVQGRKLIRFRDRRGRFVKISKK